MWLIIALSSVALGLVLLVLAALSAWRRWQRMRRAGGRFTDRVSSLTSAIDGLAGLRQDTERLPSR